MVLTFSSGIRDFTASLEICKGKEKENLHFVLE